MQLDIPTKLPIKSLYYWISMAVAVTAVASLLFAISRFSLAWAVFWFFVVFADFPFAIYLFLYYTRATYQVGDDKIITVTGTIFQKTRVVFYTSIKDVEAREDPLARLFGVKTIRIWSVHPEETNIFGFRFSRPEAYLVLKSEDADELKKFIGQRMGTTS